MSVIGNKYGTYITGYTHDGAGVGRINGQTVFVTGALLGEEVLVEITEEKRGILKGDLLRVLAPHAERTEPICPVYPGCGGCKLQHISYAEQLRIKENLVRETLRRIGGMSSININPVLGMDEPWGYRNKGHFHVGCAENRIVLGFYEEESHDLASYLCRHLFSENITKLTAYLEEILNKYKITVFAQDGKGLRAILVRESRANGEILIMFISKGDFSSEQEGIAREICRKFPAVVGVCLNYNDKQSGGLIGANTKVILGKDWIEDRLGAFRYAISMQSFFQINNQQAQILFEKVVEYAGLTGKETVIDAYCGTGSISLFLARKAKKVIGIEIIREAVKDAEKNAALNDINNVEFLEGEAEKIMPNLVRQGINPDVVVVDPPRRGCGKALLDSILYVQPKRVIYVSCNPATLARDLKILAGGGYEVQEVQPVDMFPQTAHVECVVLMSRVDK